MKNVIEQIIHQATLAPSGHNTQPWKFIVDNESITICADYERELKIVDPDHHAIFISLGCAVENLVIAAGNFGFSTDVNIVEDEDVRIRIGIKPALKKEENILFEQIGVRQSTRNRYNGVSIPSRHLSLLQNIKMEEGVHCVIINNRNEFDNYIQLVKEACIRQISNEEFIKELVKWIRFNRGKAAATNDGLFSKVMGNPNVPDWFGRFIVGITIDPKKEARKCEELIRSSSALVVFVGDKDDKPTWINVGRSFERFALMASYLNINLAHENMPCEEKPVREKLAALMRLKEGQQPLLFLRMGYSAKMPYSYRRPVNEVMIDKVSELRDRQIVHH